MQKKLAYRYLMTYAKTQLGLGILAVRREHVRQGTCYFDWRECSWHTLSLLNMIRLVHLTNTFDY